MEVIYLKVLRYDCNVSVHGCLGCDGLATCPGLHCFSSDENSESTLCDTECNETHTKDG